MLTPNNTYLGKTEFDSFEVAVRAVRGKVVASILCLTLKDNIMDA